MLERGTLCVVSGPCYAGPAGCVDDKTGADDGLPPGEYVGHCPEERDPCDQCMERCLETTRGTLEEELAFQSCLSDCVSLSCATLEAYQREKLSSRITF